MAVTPTVTGVSVSGLDAIRSGFFSNFTATANMSNGTTQTVTPLSLTQGGTNRDLITGQIALGSIAGNISGNVTGDGRLILGGTFTFTTGGTTAILVFGGWDTRLSGASGMTGQWAHTLQATGLTGNAYQENTFVTMTHLTTTWLNLQPDCGGSRRWDAPAVRF